MRVIAGSLGGRVFDAPKGHRTHPMSDKVRGALFNALGDITDMTVLDAFAGSGALSFEAISRGAKKAIAIEIDKRAKDTIQRNAEKLEITDKIKAIRANSSSWSDNNKDKEFDIVITAPPYDSLQQNIIQKLTVHLAKDGVYVLDWPGSLDPPTLDGMEQVSLKNYGDAQLIFYRKKA